jgi:hypothetical protein
VGTWGDRVGWIVGDPSADPTNQRFKLQLAYWRSAPAVLDPGDPAFVAPDLLEVFDNLSAAETDSDFYEKRLHGRSLLISADKVTGGLRPDNSAGSAYTLLANGNDGATLDVDDFAGDPNAGPGALRALAALEEIDEIAILAAPDEGYFGTALTDRLIQQCERLKDRFAIINSPPLAPPLATHFPSQVSRYAAYYFPWLKVYDAASRREVVVPPAGHIAGIYARVDLDRGVHKAPANEIVRGITKLDVNITRRQQELLNPRHVNCIRKFEGRGVRVWGARCTTRDTEWKYVNVRRLFIFLEESIEEGTQWVVFEPNDESTWARVRQSVTGFLNRVWRDGALMGATPEEAFFVKCDRSTMTQDDIDNGRLIMIIGVAPVKPAEFVIIRIGQWTGGSEVTEL